MAWPMSVATAVGLTSMAIIEKYRPEIEAVSRNIEAARRRRQATKRQQPARRNTGNESEIHQRSIDNSRKRYRRSARWRHEPERCPTLGEQRTGSACPEAGVTSAGVPCREHRREASASEPRRSRSAGNLGNHHDAGARHPETSQQALSLLMMLKNNWRYGRGRDIV